MKKLISFVACIGIIMSLVVPIHAVDDTEFIEYTPQYNILGIFDNGVSAVRTGAEYVLINTNNKVKKHINGEILGYKDHVTRIYRNEKVVFLNDAGVEFLNITGIYAKPIINGKVAVQNENFMYGLYNDKGELLLAHDYTNIVYGTGTHILLHSNTGWTEYDIKHGSVIRKYDKVYSSDEEYVICSVDEKFGVINFDGDILLPFQFDKIGVSGDSFVAYSGETTSCYDIAGNVLYSGKPGVCGVYSEGLYYNNLNGIHSYKRASGTTAINLSSMSEIQFGEPFYDGIAVVQCANKRTYIDDKGNLLTDQMWDKAYRFSNGYALVMNKVANPDANTFTEQWYIIDETFSVVKTLEHCVYIDTTYPASTDFSDGYIRTIDSETGLMGFIRLDSLNIQGYLLGDINCDGYVDIDDSLLLFQNSLYPDYYPISYPGTLDFTKDGYVDIDDSLLLFQYSLYPDYYPIG